MSGLESPSEDVDSDPNQQNNSRANGRYGQPDLGSLFLRLQLSLPEGNADMTPPTEDDVEESRALQTLLGESLSDEKDIDKKKTSSGGTPGPGAAAGRGVARGKDGAGGAGGEGRAAGSGGGVSVGSGTVARLLGVPASLWGTVKDVQVAVEGVLDALEVRGQREGGKGGRLSSE